MKGGIKENELSNICSKIKTLAKANTDAAVSSGEVAKVIGVTRGTASCYIRKLIVDGVVEYAGSREDTTMDGRVCWTPVYRLKGAK